MVTREQPEPVIATFAAQRAIPGEADVEAAPAPLRQKLAEPEEKKAPHALALEGQRRPWVRHDPTLAICAALWKDVAIEEPQGRPPA